MSKTKSATSQQCEGEWGLKTCTKNDDDTVVDNVCLPGVYENSDDIYEKYNYETVTAGMIYMIQSHPKTLMTMMLIILCMLNKTFESTDDEYRNCDNGDDLHIQVVLSSIDEDEDDVVYAVCVPGMFEVMDDDDDEGSDSGSDVGAGGLNLQNLCVPALGYLARCCHILASMWKMPACPVFKGAFRCVSVYE